MNGQVKDTYASPVHGGDLYSASLRFGIPVLDWIDLSTGINPKPYPLPVLEPRLFNELPYLNPAFLQAATEYYGGSGFVACHGSQPIIDLLPALLPEKPVLLPSIGYQEHQQRWQQTGLPLAFYHALSDEKARLMIEDRVTQHDGHLLLINPNNPSGQRFSPDTIYRWASQMRDDCYLIVDEAFIDLDPTESVLNDYDRFQHQANLIVLRSFGKFFGLAGVRLSFVFANALLCQQLSVKLGSWAISGPAQAIAKAALNDHVWQQAARLAIEKGSNQLSNAMQPVCEKWQVQCLCEGLFHSYLMPVKQAEALYLFLAHEGVLTRVINVDSKRSILRIGLIDQDKTKSVERVKYLLGLCVESLNF